MEKPDNQKSGDSYNQTQKMMRFQKFHNTDIQLRQILNTRTKIDVSFGNINIQQT